MRNLILTLIASMMLFSCVSVNPATGNYPVTGDVLEAWISGIPYEFVDERQYFRSATDNNVSIPGLWIDKDKKGNWYVIYNLQADGAATAFDPGSPPTPTARFAPFESIRYVERPFRK